MLGLLDHDLLQALALYALVGALLHRMAIADNLYGALRKAIGLAAPRGAPAPWRASRWARSWRR